jgi:hypothetical protein
MKVQLSGKEYVSNLEGLGFDPMLPHFFLINYLLDGVVGPHGSRWGWSGPRGKFEFKIKHEFKFRQDLE